MGNPYRHIPDETLAFESKDFLHIHAILYTILIYKFVSSKKVKTHEVTKFVSSKTPEVTKNTDDTR